MTDTSARYASIHNDEIDTMLPGSGGKLLCGMLNGSLAFQKQPFTSQSKEFFGDGIAIPVTNLNHADIDWMQDRFAVTRANIPGWVACDTGEVLQGDVVMVFAAMAPVPALTPIPGALPIHVVSRNQQASLHYGSPELTQLIEHATITSLSSAPVPVSSVNKPPLNPPAHESDADYAESPRTAPKQTRGKAPKPREKKGNKN